MPVLNWHWMKCCKQQPKRSQQVQQRLEDANIDNASLVDDLANLATGFGHELDVRKENAGDDGRVVVEPTQPTNGDAMAKAVAMVKDVRVFANLIEGKGRNGEDFYGKVNDFDQLTMAASAMVEQEADKFVLLAELAEIAAEINAGLKVFSPLAPHLILLITIKH